MDRWDKLYKKVDRGLGVSRQAEEQQRAEEQAREMQEKWCAVVTEEVMKGLHAQAVQRARDLEKTTRVAVQITYPAQPPSPELAFSEAEPHFMKVSMGQAVVHVYSARRPGRFPTLHVAVSTEQLRPTAEAPQSVRDPKRLAKQRLMSNPVCRVHAGPHGAGYELHHMNGAGLIKLDSIVFKIFDELVNRWRTLSARPLT